MRKQVDHKSLKSNNSYQVIMSPFLHSWHDQYAVSHTNIAIGTSISQYHALFGNCAFTFFTDANFVYLLNGYIIT